LQLSASDVWELQKTRDSKKTVAEQIAPYVPVISWAIWLLVGSLYYAYADNFGLIYGFYQSVNIGWSMGWVTPIEPSGYLSVGSLLFSTIHTSIGVMFTGIAVIYIAKQATESKDSWMMEVVKQDKLIDAANTEGIWDDIVAAVESYSSKYKIILFWILWGVGGVVFGANSVDGWDTSIALDFVLSSLSGGGYLSLPLGSSKWKYFFTALYTGIGMPITSISIGLIISFAMMSQDSDAYSEAICSVITDKELEFMKIFGIDDGDGTIDNREFIILIAVRFGAASPGLLAQIQERFEELDRERTGYIKYNDLIKGRRGKIVKKQFKKALGSTAFKMATLLQNSDSAMSNSPNNKREMYEIQDSFNEADEVANSSSDSDSEGDVENQISCVGQHLGEHMEPDADDQDSVSARIENQVSPTMEPSICFDDSAGAVREFRATSVDVDIESEITSGLPSSKKTDEDKEKKVEVKVDTKTGTGEKSKTQPNNNRKTINSANRTTLGDSDSFYKVTKAAQMWKKKTSQEEESKSQQSTSENVSSPLSPSESSESKTPTSLIPLTQTEKTKKPSRRETYVSQRSNSIMQAIDAKPVKRYSPKWFYVQITTPLFLSVFTWVLWLVVGTIFYAFHESRTFGEALYYSISVGYGIFWLGVDDNVASATFTRIHFSLGMVAIGLMMAAFATILVDSKTKWYVEAMKVKALEEAGNTEGYWDDIEAFFTVHGPKLKIHGIFLLWTFVGVLWSCLAIKWPLIEGLYFAVSSLTTGGLWAIPEDSPAWHYAFVAVYVVGGVPVMAISLGMIANSVSNMGGSRLLEQKISARITDEEVDMMESFGIVDDDGCIDAKEFAILTLVRIGALQPSLICMIHERFEEIDVNKTGSITYDDLKGHNSSKVSAVGKNLRNNKKHVNRKLGFT